LGGRIKDKWKWDVIYPPCISDCARSFIEGLLKENPDERASIRECRNHPFITKYYKKEYNNL
jgi:serine/threonine protein kinase